MNHGIDELGRCEVCGHYVLEETLYNLNEVLICEDCYTPPN